MRTTVRLDGELIERAKRFGAARGMTLTAVIQEALQAMLGRASRADPVTINLPASGQGGLRPGIDLDDSDAAMDLLVDDEP